MIIRWKAYLDYKDIRKIEECGSATAYKILDELRSKPDKNGIPFKDSEEAKRRKGKVIPTEIYIRENPHAKKSFIREVEK